MEGSGGGGADGRIMMVIYQTGTAKRWGGVGRCKVQWHRFSGRIRYSTAAAANVNEDNDRGGTAPLPPPSATMLWETMATTTGIDNNGNQQGLPRSSCPKGPN